MDQQKVSQTLVSVIIPAFNEAETIGHVIKTALSHPQVGEILVIDDGSTDNTGDIATNAGATLIRLTENGGKGHAMDVGVKTAKNDVVCFLDADIRGFTTAMLTRLMTPVVERRYDMFVALRDKRIYWVNKIVRLSPLIGGERAMTKELWRMVPPHLRKNFEIEIALNYYAKRRGKRMGFAFMPGLSHTVKEKKYGFLQGFIRRLAMMYDLMFIAIRLYGLESVKNFFSQK